jgi:RimJ/RimL family protein N-acetyltransferase
MPQIRDARPEDVPTLCAAERNVVQQFDGMLVSQPDEVSESNFIDKLAAISGGRGKYLVVEEGASLVAHASLWPMGLKKVSHVLRLDMCVHLGHWRQGHGERLLRALIAWAGNESTGRKIELLVRSENKAAVALYLKLGFIEEGRLKQRIRLGSGRYVDDITMALFLAQSEA